jgi:hypothetical protein
MSIQRIAISADKGMMPDINPALIPEGGYLFALNATLEQHSGDAYILQNDASNKLVTLFPSDLHCLGHISIVENGLLILFMLNTRTGVGEIGYLSYEDITPTNVPILVNLLLSIRRL